MKKIFASIVVFIFSLFITKALAKVGDDFDDNFYILIAIIVFLIGFSLPIIFSIKYLFF